MQGRRGRIPQIEVSFDIGANLSAKDLCAAGSSRCARDARLEYVYAVYA